MNHFEKVRDYLLDLGYNITHEDSTEELFVIQDEEKNLMNVIVDCEDPILIIEMPIIEIKDDASVYKELLIKNREIVHGAFTLDNDGKKLIFRDTLQLENLDLNELEGSLNSLALLLSEYYNQLIEYAKN
ncbi:YbjN domain-containing protein [Limibacter armeniacum]|uniref:YbjN domain-containing protein n=1 Tax=Limibacter armeniacum TaxID=466084 RepID=UPI002FE53F18